MPSILLSSFLATLAALAKVAIIVVACAWLVRRNIFNETHVRALSGVVVHLSLPTLVFSSIVSNFNVSAYPDWWKFPLVGAALNLSVLALGPIIFKKDKEQRRTLSAMIAFQNANYLILPLGEVLFPDQFERFSIYIFLMLLTYNPLLWSLGSFHISHRQGMKMKWSHLFTTPFCATVLALLLVFTGLARYLPSILVGSTELVGKSCVPMAMVVLGFTMGALRVSRMPSFWVVFRVAAIKLVVVPLLMFFILKYTSLSSGALESSFWILEASSPPATGLALQAVHFGGDEKLVCGIMVVTYLLALFTIPLFFSIVQAIL